MAAFSTTNIVSRYIPLAGGASALAFSVNVMDPSLFKRFFAPNDLAIANGLWLNAHIGVGARLYSSKHMKNICTSKKVVYTAFGTMMFNFGSVLFWATSKKFLPDCKGFNILVGLGSGIMLLAIGEMYLREIDSKTQTEEETSEE